MDKRINITLRGHLLKGIIENPQGSKILILVHGFTGDWNGPDNIFVKLSKKLQEENYAVLRFSFIGTPPSEGDFRNMTVASETEDLIEILKYANSQGYKDIGIIGESMGAAIVANSYDPDLMKVIVFWYPSLNFSKDSFTNYLKEDLQAELKKNGFVLTDGFKVGKKFISQINSINFQNTISRFTSPILFLHGDNDTDVPVYLTKETYKLANEPKELNIIEGAEHCFSNEQGEVINLTIEFIKRYF
jgi:hypothetical protein